MSTRPPDVVTIESDAGSFDAFESLSIVNDIEGLTEATFAFGDESSWEALEQIIAPGEPFSVLVNGRPRMAGRAEVNDYSATVASGFLVTLTCRTKLADARYRSAEPTVRVAKTSIKDYILALYAPLGYVESDFQFSEATARDLMTGKSQGGKDAVDLAPLQAEQAKVNPPETTYDAAERHLKRHHMTHWDGPDGKILVGAPDDTQAPLYRAICKKAGPASKGNNCGAIHRIRDWSEVAGDIAVFGTTPGREIAKTALRGAAVDLDLAAVFAKTGHFSRPVIIPSEQAKTLDAATAIAARELSARKRRKDVWELTLDGWSYWDGNEAVVYAHNTVIDVDVEGGGASARGSYLVHRVQLTYNESGLVTQLTAVAPGVWAI